MSRPSPSRQSSFSYTETPSRRSSLTSNPNIFSDDYALEPIDSTLDLTLIDSEEANHVADGPSQTREVQNITPYPAIPPRLSTLPRPNSISKRPLSNDNISTARGGAIERASSTASSRFSFIRPQEPYSGPTQPSHPYAMYPQITRASSIASESTIRPHQTPFVSTGGPEHPYALYPQNTAPEDSDEDIGTQPIPLGFPRLGLPRPGMTGNSGSDVGDIIGSDGHIEQLPPYTRYADNVVAKGDMANIRDTLISTASRRASQRSTNVTSETQSIRFEVRDSSEREVLLNEDMRKENWKDKARRKVCGGIALWLLVLIGTLVVLAGILGGVIGGVVGRHQGTDLALKAGMATATIYLDADPAATNKNTPACPTGRYTIPFEQAQEINSCVADSGFSRSWGCLDFAFLGITITDPIINGVKTLQVSFDDYSMDTQGFRYGPQPPDFNGTAFDLHPSSDRDNKEFGVAMFFYKEFDKLTILPPRAIIPDKRHVFEHDVHERGTEFDGRPLQIGDQPWYCFWNSTINEFWIFLEKPAAPTTSFSSDAPSSTVAATNTWSGVSGFPTPSVTKRGLYTTPYLPQYPQRVKMIEKRKPIGNVQPYCQRMQVLADWRIVPREDNELVYIKESQYELNPVSVGKRSTTKRGSTTQELQSNCVCEWMSR